MLLGWSSQESERGGACSTRGWDEKCIQNFCQKTWMVETTRKIIFEWILRKHGWKLWTGCMGLRLGSNGGLLWTRCWTFGSHKGGAFLYYLSECSLLKKGSVELDARHFYGHAYYNSAFQLRIHRKLYGFVASSSHKQAQCTWHANLLLLINRWVWNWNRKMLTSVFGESPCSCSNTLTFLPCTFHPTGCEPYVSLSFYSICR
jgi:hypothetical protein